MTLGPMLSTPLSVREGNLPAPFASGKLTASPEVVSMAGSALNSTVTLTSTNGSRAIAVSTDGGITFNTLAYTINVTGQLVLALTFAVTHVQFTGSVGDAYVIL